MIRAIAISAVLLCGLAAGPARAIDADAIAPIDALDQGLLAAMHAGRSTSFADRYATLAPIVERAFDLDTILETSVGPRWQSFTPAQQQALKAEFLRFTVASYVANFSSFSGERFVTSPNGRTIGADQVVETKILPVHGDAAKIDYVMRQEPAGWRAVDVLLDGAISRVAVQRSDFRNLVENGPDPLIDSLRRKVANLSGGVGVP